MSVNRTTNSPNGTQAVSEGRVTLLGARRAGKRHMVLSLPACAAKSYHVRKSTDVVTIPRLILNTAGGKPVSLSQQQLREVFHRYGPDALPDSLADGETAFGCSGQIALDITPSEQAAAPIDHSLVASGRPSSQAPIINTNSSFTSEITLLDPFPDHLHQDMLDDAALDAEVEKICASDGILLTISASWNAADRDYALTLKVLNRLHRHIVDGRAVNLKGVAAVITKIDLCYDGSFAAPFDEMLKHRRFFREWATLQIRHRAANTQVADTVLISLLTLLQQIDIAMAKREDFPKAQWNGCILTKCSAFGALLSEPDVNVCIFEEPGSGAVDYVPKTRLWGHDDPEWLAEQDDVFAPYGTLNPFLFLAYALAGRGQVFLRDADEIQAAHDATPGAAIEPGMIIRPGQLLDELVKDGLIVVAKRSQLPKSGIELVSSDDLRLQARQANQSQ